MATQDLYRSRTAWGYLVVLATVALLARLPQLVSPNLLLEGDECIVGVMGLHVLRGKAFPLFMYGQRYGLAIVEAPTAAVSFAMFGSGAVSLKLAMLAIWIVGAAFYFLAFSRVLGVARSFWMTLLLILLPAWATASMKALCGYVTAFSAAAVTLHAITGNDSRRVLPWLAAGVATAIVFLSQRLWLPGLFPIVLYYLVSGRRLSPWIAYTSATAGTVGAVMMASWLIGGVEIWHLAQPGNSQLLASALPLVRQIYVNLTGSFHMGIAVAPGRVTALVASLWLGLLGLALLRQGYRLVTRRYLLWSHLLCASVLLTLVSNWALLAARDGRYMLALNVPLVFLVGVEFFDLADRYRLTVRRSIAVIAVLAVLQGVAMREFASYTYMWWTNTASSPSETKTLRTVIGYLESRGISRVYATNPLLQWTIAFYSDEAVVARWKARSDRYPPYIAAVDRALEAGHPVAIVGYAGYTNGLERQVRDPESIVTIDGKYFVYIGPDRPLLESAGFLLTR